jgi:glycosyltransferase involved in cell wall biosynthesis
MEYLSIMNDLTIVICVYNGGTGSHCSGRSNLRTCLDSLKHRLPTMIVDDGSTDDTERIVLEHINDDMTYIHHEENLGLRDSFNQAVKHVETPFFLRVDDDIVFPETPNWPEILVQHMREHRDCGVCGATQMVPVDRANYNGKHRLHCAGQALLPKYANLKTLINGKYRVCQSTMGCFSCFRKAAWDLVCGITCGQWMRAETEDICIRIQRAGYAVHCLPFTFAHHQGMTVGKTGEYNRDRAKRIVDHMVKCYGYHFYAESPEPCLRFLKPIQDVE